MIFNNTVYKDHYWESDAGEQWKFSWKEESTNECYICEKHKYTVIFLSTKERNTDIKQITDNAIIEEVRKTLNIEEHCDSSTPIICGTMINGGFLRKL